MTEAAHIAGTEVVRLHAFLGAWFRGDVSSDRFGPDLEDVLHPDFETVQPSGLVLDRTALLDPLRAAYGQNPAFRITIEEPRLLGTWRGLILFTYVERQTGARNSAPENRRRSTVLFETDPRLVWRHLVEVGLPD